MCACLSVLPCFVSDVYQTYRSLLFFLLVCELLFCCCSHSSKLKFCVSDLCRWRRATHAPCLFFATRRTRVSLSTSSLFLYPSSQNTYIHTQLPRIRSSCHVFISVSDQTLCRTHTHTHLSTNHSQYTHKPDFFEAKQEQRRGPSTSPVSL